MISRPFPTFQQIWHRFRFQWLYLHMKICRRHIRMWSQGWAVNFTSFLNLIFGRFLQFGPLRSAAVRTDEWGQKPRTTPLKPATWSLSMLQLERGAVTLCSVCALLRNFDKDLHGDPMLLWLLLEVVTTCGVTSCIFDMAMHVLCFIWKEPILRNFWR